MQGMMMLGSTKVDDIEWFENIGKDKYELQQVIEENFDKSILQTQIVSYYDKIDGLMVSFHELVAGNTSFKKVIDIYLKIFKRIAI
jgi:hypothetical protein